MQIGIGPLAYTALVVTSDPIFVISGFISWGRNVKGDRSGNAGRITRKITIVQLRGVLYRRLERNLLYDIYQREFHRNITADVNKFICSCSPVFFLHWNNCAADYTICRVLLRLPQGQVDTLAGHIDTACLNMPHVFLACSAIRKLHLWQKWRILGIQTPAHCR